MRQGRVVLAALAAVSIVVVWYVALFGPQRADRRRVAEQLAAAEAEEQELRSTLSRLRVLAGKQEAREAYLARLRRLVPPEADVAGFILAANHAAVRSGVDWISVAPAAPAAGTAGGASAIPVSIAVNGGFFPVLDYVGRLENLERLVVVDSLQVSSSTQAGGELELSVTLSARLFTTASPAAPAPGGAPAVPAPGPQEARSAAGAGAE